MEIKTWFKKREEAETQKDRDTKQLFAQFPVGTWIQLPLGRGRVESVEAWPHMADWDPTARVFNVDLVENVSLTLRELVPFKGDKRKLLADYKKTIRELNLRKASRPDVRVSCGNSYSGFD